MLLGDAILTATHLINRMPSRILSFVSLIEKLHETYLVTHINHHLPLRVFGCYVFVHLYHPPSKLDPRAVKCVFLGYPVSQKGYKCYNLVSKHLFVSRDVTFHENIPYFSKSSIQGESWNEFQPLENVPKPTPNVPEPIPPSFPIQIRVDPPSLPQAGGEGTHKNHHHQYKVYSRKTKRVKEPCILEEVPNSEPMMDSTNEGDQV